MYAKTISLGWKYWYSVYEDLERQKILSTGERDMIKGMSVYMKKNNFLSDAQVKKLWKIVQKIEKETDYILKEK